MTTAVATFVKMVVMTLFLCLMSVDLYLEKNCSQWKKHAYVLRAIEKNFCSSGHQNSKLILPLLKNVQQIPSFLTRPKQV